MHVFNALSDILVSSKLFSTTMEHGGMNKQSPGSKNPPFTEHILPSTFSGSSLSQRLENHATMSWRPWHLNFSSSMPLSKYMSRTSSRSATTIARLPDIWYSVQPNPPGSNPAKLAPRANPAKVTPSTRILFFTLSSSLCPNSLILRLRRVGTCKINHGVHGAYHLYNIKIQHIHRQTQRNTKQSVTQHIQITSAQVHRGP